MEKKTRILKHMWKIEILNPLNKETIDEEIIDRLEKSKYIEKMGLSVSKLKNIYYNHTGKNGLIKISKI